MRRGVCSTRVSMLIGCVQLDVGADARLLTWALIWNFRYRDEEDGVLLDAEAEAETIARQRAHDEWLAGKGADKANADDDEQEFYKNESYDHPDGPAVTMELDDEAEEGVRHFLARFPPFWQCWATCACTCPDGARGLLLNRRNILVRADLSTFRPRLQDEPAHLNIPTAADIEQLILQRKKQVLLEQYASVELQGEEEQAKELTHR